MYKNYKQKVLKIIADEGLLSFFKKISKFIVYKIIFIQNFIIFELNLENFVNKIETQIELDLKIATEKDIDSIIEEYYNYDEFGRQYLKNQQQKGDKCVIAIKNGKIIGYVWIMKGHMELSPFNHIQISNNKTYIYNGFVLKSYRGKRVLNAIDLYIINMLIKDNKKFIITTVATNNKPPIKARERIGFKRIGKITQFRIFGLRYDHISKKDLIYLQNP